MDFDEIKDKNEFNFNIMDTEENLNKVGRIRNINDDDSEFEVPDE